MADTHTPTTKHIMNQYNLANTENRTRDKLHGFRCRVGGEIFPKKNQKNIEQQQQQQNELMIMMKYSWHNELHIYV